MDGIHDMGGMHGFGAVVPEAGEPVFHERWEGRTFALSVLAAVTGLQRGGMRPRIEAIEPATYLASSYYERWALALEAALVDDGVLRTDEIDARAAAGPTGGIAGAAVARGDGDGATDDLAALAVTLLARPGQPSGQPVPARYAVGDRVTVRRMAPAPHHRCPRYVRGVTGVVDRVEGGWRHPGADDPEAVYTVRFAMRDLWGDDAEPGHLHVDLWERYLA
ncbi:MAG TPA: nitrile hydratase subunit beta [Acidimicrobiales bacterium]